MTRPADLSELGLASAALMHDLQSLVGALREHAALVVEEIEAGHLPLSSARSVLAGCDEIQGLVRDVVAEAAGRAAADPFDPVKTVHREISRVLQHSSALRISCRSTLPGAVWVEGSRTLLERSIANLLRNAARHARECVDVSVAVDASGGTPRLLIAVEDDGSGVAAEVRARLFTPGAGADAGGSGVGLASAAWAVRRLGGTVRLAEPGVLGGARFEIRLPFRRPAAETRAPAVPARPLAGRTVAVIDDDEMVRRSVVRLLAHGGARVVTADPAELARGEGLEALAGSAPDAVLLDLHLGSASGVDVWHLVNARFPEMARRVAFFSGAAGWGDDDAEVTATGRPVIPKGMDIDDFLCAVDELVRAGAAGST